MQFKLSSLGEARTQDYVGTTTNLHDDDLERIKANVKLHNQQVRATSRKYGRTIGQLRRVRIMPRGPRAEAAEAVHRFRRAYDSYLPMGLGERFDIYVGFDSTAQYELQNELSTGMTVSEMRKVSKLEHDIMMLKFEGRQRKRNKECMS